MLTIFGEIERYVAELYPYRYVITPLLLAAALGALYAAYRAGLHRPLLAHRLATAAVAVPAVVVAVFLANYLLSPLWERSHLDEASPLAGIVSQETGTGSAPVVMLEPGAPPPGITVRGMFKGADDFHFGRGDALILRTADGNLVLRFEDFSVRNGPDLYVYLSKDANGRRVEESLNLGRLKATDGAFNYEIPEGIDLSEIKSVVVWCKQFGVLFAHATLG